MQEQQQYRVGIPSSNCLDDMMVGIDFSMPENFFNDEDDFCFTKPNTAAPFVPTPPPLSSPPVEQPLPSSATPAVAEMNNNNNTITADHQHTDGLFVASFPITDEDSVNLYMFFDPIQQAVVCPRQTITFQTGNVVSTAIVGPMVIQQAQLESLFDSAKNLSSAHLSALPMAGTNKTVA